MRYYVTNIDWDTNTSEGHERALFLPEDVVVHLDIDNLEDDEKVGCAISDYLGVRYGFEVNGFSYIDENEVQGGERVK
jgi:hypothetical protein